MEFLRKLFGKKEKKRAVTWDQLARLGGFIESPTLAGVSVTEETALGISALWCGIKVISQDVGSLEPVLYREIGQQREVATSNPVHVLLAERPNPEQTRPVFFETLQAHALLFGNAFAEIERSGAGEPLALWPIHPGNVKVGRTESGQLAYEVTTGQGSVILSSYDVLHVPGLSADGSVGYQLLKIARETLGFGIACQRYGSSFFGKGTNWPDKKNLPDDVTRELYGLLLDGMPGTIVLLDWDYRVPLVPHSRIRHIKRDWGHLSVLQLAALLTEADLLIGVDSGPWHLSNFTRTPALGVFHDFFPWCVSLPRPSGLNAVLTRDSHSHCTRERRKHWNPIEYPAPKPRAKDIAKHALRMLAGSRYGLPIGRDVMLQHLIRDKNKASTSTSPIADRNNTLDFLFRQLPSYEAPEIVETGCVRSPDDWGAGFFGYLAGAWLHKRKGTLTSVDLDLNHLNKAQAICKDWPGNFVLSDSVAYLTAREAPIDVLYLDSLDCDMPNHADHALAEFQAAENKLTNKSLVIYDDTVYAGQWQGKGAKAIPYMLENGWRIQASGYQTILALQPTSR